jgi:hypothetical protein
MRAHSLASAPTPPRSRIRANDARRSTFTVESNDRLLAVSGDDLATIAEWPLAAIDGAIGRGHGTSPGRGLALVCGRDRVWLLRVDGTVVWSVGHQTWDGDFESGCAWFDDAGRPIVVMPSPEYDGCLIAWLDDATGQVRDQAFIEAAPAGIDALFHPDGWVGLSEGEGQDATHAWWVRVHEGRIGLIGALWNDEVLVDVDPTGERIITTPHYGGPLTVRSFPRLASVREVDWEETLGYEACFAGEHIVARTRGDVAFVTIDPAGAVEPLELPLDSYAWLMVPAADGSFVTVDGGSIQRWALT